jgi:hypothetical protein
MPRWLPHVASLRGSGRLIAACIAIAPPVAFAVAHEFPRSAHYKTTATINFADSGLDDLVFGDGLFRGDTVDDRDVVLVPLLPSEFAFRKSARELGRSESTLRGDVHMERSGTNAVKLTSTGDHPYATAVFANQVADNYLKYRNRTARERLRTALRRLRRGTPADERRARYLDGIRKKLPANASVTWAVPPNRAPVLSPLEAALWSLGLSIPLGLGLILLLRLLRRPYGETPAGA